MEAPGDLLIEISGVARRLDVSPTTVRNMERRGDLPLSTRLERTGYRVWRLSDIEEIQARRDGCRQQESGVAALNEIVLG